MSDQRGNVESGLVSAWVLSNIVLPKAFWKHLRRCGPPWFVFTACPLVVQPDLARPGGCEPLEAIRTTSVRRDRVGGRIAVEV